MSRDLISRCTVARRAPMTLANRFGSLPTGSSPFGASTLLHAPARTALLEHRIESSGSSRPACHRSPPAQSTSCNLRPENPTRQRSAHPVRPSFWPSQLRHRCMFKLSLERMTLEVVQFGGRRATIVQSGRNASKPLPNLLIGRSKRCAGEVSI